MNLLGALALVLVVGSEASDGDADVSDTETMMSPSPQEKRQQYAKEVMDKGGAPLALTPFLTPEVYSNGLPELASTVTDGLKSSRDQLGYGWDRLTSKPLTTVQETFTEGDDTHGLIKLVKYVAALNLWALGTLGYVHDSLEEVDTTIDNA